MATLADKGLKLAKVMDHGKGNIEPVVNYNNNEYHLDIRSARGKLYEMLLVLSP